MPSQKSQQKKAPRFWPAFGGFPALRGRMADGQKLAALEQLPVCIAKRPLRSGGVTGGGGPVRDKIKVF